MPKKGIGGRVRGFFYEESDEKPQEKAPPSPPPPSTSFARPVVMTAPQATTTIAVDPASPQVRKYYDGLGELMKPVSSTGYMAFLAQLAALGNIIKDDATLIPAAAAAAGGIGCAEIDHEIQDNLDVLGQQETSFSTALQKKVTADVGQKQASIAQTDQEIAALEAKIRDLRTRRDALVGEVHAVQQSAEQERSAFETARTQHATMLLSLRERARRNMPQPAGGGTT